MSNSKCSKQNEGQWVWEKKENGPVMWNCVESTGISASVHCKLTSSTCVLTVFCEVVNIEFWFMFAVDTSRYVR